MSMPTLDIDVEKLIGDLSPEKARLVLQSLAGLKTRHPERIEAIRRVFEKVAYQPRSQHARRLFTGLFEPFLVPNDRAAAMGWTAPGLLHRLDVGAIWILLEIEYGAAVQTAQRRLTELIEAYGHRNFGKAPEVAVMADDLRDKALAFLNRILASRDRLDTALQGMNAWRCKEAQRNQIAPPPPVGPSDVVFWHSLLKFRDLATLALMESQRDRERGLRLTAREENLIALANVVGHSGGDRRVGAIVPLHLLNARSDFQAAADYLALAIDAESKHLVLAAIDHHFRLACEALAENLIRITGKPGSGPLMLRQEEALASSFRELENALDALADLDLLASPVIGGSCRNHVAELLSRIECEVYPALLARAVVAASTPNAPSDQAMLIHMLTGLHRWMASLSDQLYWGSAPEEFRKELLRILHIGLGKALTPGTHTSPLSRFSHIARVEAIAQVMGVSLVEREMPPTPIFIRAALQRLADSTPLAAMEEGVIQVLTKAAEAELAKIKYWKDPLLSEFVVAARNRCKTGVVTAESGQNRL